MKLENASPLTVSQLWADLEPKVQQAHYLEESAQELARSIHDQFQESVAIARVFATVSLEDLPSSNRSFVEKLADSAGADGELKQETPVLSLIGTYGQEENWKDPHKSEGHVGIPLISSAFVGAIPMIARLIKELGLPIEWVDSHDTESVVETLGTKAGLFYVADAAEATDQEGRKIIAAQDFVSTYGVKSVFGAGGAYPNGQMITLIVFCRDTFSRSVAELFLPLTDLFKSGTVTLAESGSVFSNS
jgi:hypothetical protein